MGRWRWQGVIITPGEKQPNEGLGWGRGEIEEEQLLSSPSSYLEALAWNWFFEGGLWFFISKVPASFCSLQYWVFSIKTHLVWIALDGRKSYLIVLRSFSWLCGSGVTPGSAQGRRYGARDWIGISPPFKVSVYLSNPSEFLLWFKWMLSY